MVIKKNALNMKKKKKTLTSSKRRVKYEGFYSKISSLSLTTYESSEIRQNVLDDSSQEEIDGGSSLFYTQLQAARDENLSEGFSHFAHEVSKFCGNLPSLLYNRRRIFDAMLTELKRQDTLGLETIYKISPGFFRDVVSLKEDLKTFLQEWLEEFSKSLSNREDPTLFKSMFQSLTYILQNIVKNSTLDHREIINISIFLLDNKKYPDFAVEFSAIALSPVIRKSKFRLDLLAYLKNVAQNEPDKNTGIVKLLIKAIKNLGSGFYAGSLIAWSRYLEILSENENLLKNLQSYLLEHELNPSEFKPYTSLTLERFGVDPSAFAGVVGLLADTPEYLTKESSLMILENYTSFYENDSVLSAILKWPESLDSKNFWSGVILKRPDAVISLRDNPKFKTFLLPIMAKIIEANIDENIFPFVNTLSKLCELELEDQNESIFPEFTKLQFRSNNFSHKVISDCYDKYPSISIKALVMSYPCDSTKVISKVVRPPSWEEAYFTLEILKKDSKKYFSNYSLFDNFDPSKCNNYFGRVLISFCTLNPANVPRDLLLPLLSSGLPLVRKSVLYCLTLVPDAHPILKTAYKSEETEATVQDYRERLRLLSFLEETPGSPHQEERIRILLSNLSVNLSLLWKPVLQILISFPLHSSDSSLFWKIYFEVLTETYPKIRKPAESGNSIDYVNFRNLLLSMLELIPVNQLERKGKDLSNLFLDQFLKHEMSNEISIPNISKSLAQHIKIMNRLPNLRSISRFEEIKSFVIKDMLSDSKEANRSLALDFLKVASPKLLSPDVYSILNGTIEKKSWKSGFREWVRLSNEDPELYEASGKELGSKLLAGKFKSTRSLKRPQQLATRKFILENISKLSYFSSIFETALELVWSHYPLLTFDLLMISRSYFNSEESFCKRAINLILANFKFDNKSRSKVVEIYSRLIKGYKGHYNWTSQEQNDFMSHCLLPFFSGMYQNRTISKKGFGLLRALLEDNFRWFFVSESFLNLILRELSGDKDEFFRANVTFLVDLLNVINGDTFTKLQEENVSSTTTVLLSKSYDIAEVILDSLNPKSVRFVETLSAFKSLCSWPGFDPSLKYLEMLCGVTGRIKFSSVDTQAEAVKVILSIMVSVKQEEYPSIVYKLIVKIQDLSQRAKFIEKLYKNFEAFETNIQSGIDIAFDLCRSHAEINFAQNYQMKMLLFYSAWSELKRSEFSNRRLGSECIHGILSSLDDQFIESHVLTEIRTFLKKRKLQKESVKEVLKILRTVILERSASIPSMGHLMELSNVKEEDEDFFTNIVHLQSHRRTRAVKRMAEKIENMSKFNEHLTDSLMNYVYPLCSAALFDETVTKFSELIEGAIDLIGSLASRADYESFKKILWYYINLEIPNDNSAFAKQKIKVIARILDSYHFDESVNVRSLVNNVYNLLDKNEESSTSGALYLPIVKILIISKNNSLLDEYLSKIIVKLGKGLRIRDHPSREKVRSVLNATAQLLGPKYISYILSILESSLKRGYELHVLIYSVRALLGSMTLSVGDLDTIVPNLLKLIKAEFFEGIADEEKKVSQIRTKTPEAKRNSGYHTSELMARYISKSQLLEVINPFINILASSKSFSSIEKIRKIFRHLCIGFSEHSELEYKDLLGLSYSVLSGRLTGPKHSTILVEFSLKILMKVLNETGEILPEDLEDFVPLVIEKAKTIRDIDILIEAIFFFNRLSHQGVKFRALVPLNSVFEIIVKALVIDNVFHNRTDKVKFQDVSCSILESFLNSSNSFDSKDLEAVIMFLNHVLDVQEVSVRGIKLLGASTNLPSFSSLKDPIMNKLCELMVKGSENTNILQVTQSSLLKMASASRATSKLICEFFLNQFSYGIQTGRLRAILMVEKLLKDNLYCSNVLNIFVLTSKHLAEEEDEECIRSLSGILTSLKCSESDLTSIGMLLKSWLNNLQYRSVGSGVLCRLSSGKNCSSVLKNLETDIRKFLGLNGVPVKILCDLLITLWNLYSEKSEKLIKEILPSLNGLLMSSNSNVRERIVDLLVNVAGYAKNPSEDLRSILLNLFEILKLHSFKCEEMFEKISIVLVYLSKIFDSKLIMGKLVGVAQFEVQNLPFTSIRRVILFKIAGILNPKFQLPPNILRPILKMASVLSEEKETLEIVEEFYSVLERTTTDENALNLIKDSKNKVSKLESISERKRKKGTSGYNSIKKRKVLK